MAGLAADVQFGETALYHRARDPAGGIEGRNLLSNLQATDQQSVQVESRARMDPPVALRRLFRSVGKIRQILARFHPRRAARLRALLRGAPGPHVQQRDAQPAAQLAGTAGHQIEEAAHVAHHVHGRQYQDVAGRFGYDGPRIVRPTGGQDRTEGSIWILPVHRPVR